MRSLIVALIVALVAFSNVVSAGIPIKYIGRIFTQSANSADNVGKSGNLGLTPAPAHVVDAFAKEMDEWLGETLSDPALRAEASVLRKTIHHYDVEMGRITQGGKKSDLSERELFDIGRIREKRAIVGAKLRHFPFHTRIKPLEEIYSNGGGMSVPLDHALATSARSDRIVVAVLDSGVDYNHPALAYKLARPSQDEIDSIGVDRVIHSIEMYKHRKIIAEDIAKMREESKYVKGSDEMISSLEREVEDAKRVVYKTTVGWDYNTEDHLPYDTSIIVETHGTHVAGVIVRDTDDIALVPIRYNPIIKEALGDEVEYARAKGARIINASFSTDHFLGSPMMVPSSLDGVQTTRKVIAENPDILFVVATGNEGRNIDVHQVFPASLELPNMLSVTPVDSANILPLNADYGPRSVDVAAPGTGIVSSASAVPIEIPGVSPFKGASVKGGEDVIRENNYKAYSGASTAAPFATRVAARILHINPKLTPAQVIDIIGQSVTKIDGLSNKVRFGGVINEKLALEFARRTL